MTDSNDPEQRRDFVRSGPIMVTFTSSFGNQDQEAFIQLVHDDINEAMEGFFVVVVTENITLPDSVSSLSIERGVTLVRIEDDDRK